MYIWPAHLFNPTGIKADPVPAVISGGTALSGDETVIQTDGGGRWEITFSGIVLRTPRQIRAWDAWTSYLSGGYRTVLVPLVSLITAPRPVNGSVPARPSSLHADDDFFPESVGYAMPYIEAVTVGAMPNPSTVTINVTRGARIEGGEKFSVSGLRGHKIERVISRSGQQATVAISPPYHPLIPAGSAVNFDWPVVRCRAVLGQDLAPTLSFGRRAEMNISFVEDVANV